MTNVEKKDVRYSCIHKLSTVDTVSRSFYQKIEGHAIAAIFVRGVARKVRTNVKYRKEAGRGPPCFLYFTLVRTSYTLH